MYSVPVERNIPEDGGDPDQTEQAAAHQADDHGHDRVAPAAQAAGQRVHYAAQEVGSADDPHPGQARGHHGFIGGVKVEQDLTAKVSAAAQNRPATVTQSRQLRMTRSRLSYRRAPTFWLVKVTAACEKAFMAV